MNQINNNFLLLLLWLVAHRPDLFTVNPMCNGFIFSDLYQVLLGRSRLRMYSVT